MRHIPGRSARGNNAGFGNCSLFQEELIHFISYLAVHESMMIADTFPPMHNKAVWFIIQLRCYLIAYSAV